MTRPLQRGELKWHAKDPRTCHLPGGQWTLSTRTPSPTPTHLNWNVCMMSPSIWMNVLFLAKMKVLPWPVSAKVSSGPRCSMGTGVVPSPPSAPPIPSGDWAGLWVYGKPRSMELSVVLGSRVVDCRNGGSVSARDGSSIGIIIGSPEVVKLIEGT